MEGDRLSKSAVGDGGGGPGPPRRRAPSRVLTEWLLSTSAAGATDAGAAPDGVVRGAGKQRTTKGWQRAVESIDYEAPITFAARAILRNERQLQLAQREQMLVPLVYVCVGVLAAICTSLVHLCSLELIGAKFDLVQRALDAPSAGGGGLRGGLAVYVSTSAVLAGTAAAVLELLAPTAGGSGMSAVLLLFNGTHITAAFTARTLLAKFVGLVLVAGSGLACGQEGPMIHLGVCAFEMLVFVIVDSLLAQPACALLGSGCFPPPHRLPAPSYTQAAPLVHSSSLTRPLPSAPPALPRAQERSLAHSSSAPPPPRCSGGRPSCTAA